MAKKPKTLPQADLKKTCGTCRHLNRRTADARSRIFACAFVLGVNSDCVCKEKDKQGGSLYEKFNGANGTWGKGGR